MVVQGMREVRRPVDPGEASALSPLVLAYVGDAVYELFVRTRLLSVRLPVDRLHRRCVNWVSANGQERVWQRIKERLEADEAEIARRARNAKSPAPRTASVAAYRRATSLEAVVGYLYLTGRDQRIEELLGSVLEGMQEVLGE